jgi:cell division protein FtsQ
MTDSPDKSEFIERRQQRAQRRKQKWSEFLKTSWRWLAIASLMTSVLWVATLPYWHLRSSRQIEIKGTRLLPQSSIRSLVTLGYPQSIFQVQAKDIADRLQQSAPIRHVIVERTLFPPKVTITVQERQPIAQAAIAGKPGFVDSEGTWIPLQSYPNKITKPQLVILGANSRNLELWSGLYAQVTRSPVKISQIDLRSPNNLILTTDIGMVHLGIYNDIKISKQLETLDRMRSLPQKFTPSTFAHIDLTNPEAPIIDGVIAPKSKSLPQKS